MSESPGDWMLRLASQLYPICRSITGDGVRQTLRFVRESIPLEIHEVPTGTQVFDWSVPREWQIRDAYVKNSEGERVIDFTQCNLHVLNYSVPIRKQMRLEELRPHLFSVPEHPDWVPYRTSYYAEAWGFCLSHNQLLQLKDDEFEVCVDSSLTAGSLTYGEYYLPGDEPDEVLVSCHVCHPSLANDNLSGIALATYLAREIQAWTKRRYSYRFLFIPGTIGSITWLALNEKTAPKVKHGLVLSCVGDAGHTSYKRSRRGNAEIDRGAAHVLAQSGTPFELLDFVPYGYDERQFCSPGFNLAVGCFMRTPNGRYPEYHTSADNLSLLKPASLTDSYAKISSIVSLLEGNRTYVNLNPCCEPQLGRRGLYQKTGGAIDSRSRELAMLWVLNLSDGENSLLDIAERSKLNFASIKAAADVLEEHKLLRRFDTKER